MSLWLLWPLRLQDAQLCRFIDGVLACAIKEASVVVKNDMKQANTLDGSDNLARFRADAIRRLAIAVQADMSCTCIPDHV
eukprot:2332734-Amphidinium_carterae.1